ncbi:uncharacterized protein LOC5500948 [Nematostella vectensis]|uniref:uncharacterized protein LOC5500948 n=1 Tax=Nematostella vectensis TaxID=45351 RepID=UPI0020779609|nr:uncharacterized protein LOC5500948 [Nematostella vectensis]XP_048590494.1 uncharacterized protein LOC5500948 [Nematostella vectensis]
MLTRVTKGYHRDPPERLLSIGAGRLKMADAPPNCAPSLPAITKGSATKVTKGRKKKEFDAVEFWSRPRLARTGLKAIKGNEFKLPLIDPSKGNTNPQGQTDKKASTKDQKKPVPPKAPNARNVRRPFPAKKLSTCEAQQGATSGVSKDVAPDIKRKTGQDAGQAAHPKKAVSPSAAVPVSKIPRRSPLPAIAKGKSAITENGAAVAQQHGNPVAVMEVAVQENTKIPVPLRVLTPPAKVTAWVPSLCGEVRRVDTPSKSGKLAAKMKEVNILPNKLAPNKHSVEQSGAVVSGTVLSGTVVSGAKAEIHSPATQEILADIEKVYVHLRRLRDATSAEASFSNTDVTLPDLSDKGVTRATPSAYVHHLSDLMMAFTDDIERDFKAAQSDGRAMVRWLQQDAKIVKANLEDEVSKRDAEVKSLKDKIKELQASSAEADERHQSLQAAISELTAKVEQTHCEKDDVMVDLKCCQDDSDAKTREIVNLRRDLKRKEMAQKELKNENNVTWLQYDFMMIDNEALKKEVTRLEELNTESEARNKEMELSVELLQRQLAEQTKSTEDRPKGDGENIVENAEANTTIAATSAEEKANEDLKIKCLEQALLERNESIAELEKNIEQMRTERDSAILQSQGEQLENLQNAKRIKKLEEDLKKKTCDGVHVHRKAVAATVEEPRGKSLRDGGSNSCERLLKEAQVMADALRKTDGLDSEKDLKKQLSLKVNRTPSTIKEEEGAEAKFDSKDNEQVPADPVLEQERQRIVSSAVRRLNGKPSAAKRRRRRRKHVDLEAEVSGLRQEVEENADESAFGKTTRNVPAYKRHVPSKGAVQMTGIQEGEEDEKTKHDAKTETPMEDVPVERETPGTSAPGVTSSKEQSTRSPSDSRFGRFSSKKLLMMFKPRKSKGD